MKIIATIKEPIHQEMELFEKKFSKSMVSRVALLNKITHYIVNRKGKQMRPMFVFLVAKMVSKGTVNERTYRGASVIELIHTATLVLDDVVDVVPVLPARSSRPRDKAPRPVPVRITLLIRSFMRNAFSGESTLFEYRGS